MKKILLLILTITSTSVMAADPNDTPELVLSCNAPLERVDGTLLALGEINLFKWERTQDLTGTVTWTEVATGVACEAVRDITLLADGQYYYTPIACDIDGKCSDRAYDVDPTEVFALNVKRITNPNIPTNVDGLLR